MTSTALFAGIEAGGTKFNCVIGRAGGDILHQAVFPTETPEETLPKVLQYFLQQTQQYRAIDALGIGSFGPVEINPRSAHYGQILKTPKPGWSQCDLRGYFVDALRIPVGFETDVNVAMLAEQQLGAAQGKDTAVYVTIGTGIGGGVWLGGKLLQGASHPELGHMFVQKHPDDDFEGVCPFHGSCLEGLASGPAIAKRWKIPAQQLPKDHPAWPLQAYYLAQMCVNITLCYSPEVIALGGGVATQQQMLPMIRRAFAEQINGYCNPAILENLDHYIVRSALGGNAGQIGALLLAERSLAQAPPVLAESASAN
jgi:fructokinase